MDSSSSTHPTANSSQAVQGSGSPVHKRTYQACQPCRQRKVRCDLGPVDEPHEPPCVRCRRESKECTFSTTRRKRKADGVESDGGEDDIGDDDYAARNGRKSSRTGGSLGGYETVLHNPRRSLTSGTLSAASPLDGYNLPSDGQFQQPRSYSTDNMTRRSEDGQEQEVANETAAALFQTPINIPGDALHLLLKASTESEEFQRKDTANLERRPANHPVRGSTSTHSHPSTQSWNQQGQGDQHYIANIDPAISASNVAHRRCSPPAEIVKLWSRLRFVRAGWFTAHEAISYIEYFYEYLNPLTPISLPTYRPDTGHLALLSDEPMLTVTFLTIASRYKRLTGPGGQTRSFKIHEQLWAYLQGMMTRMFWGQEQFGGGFCGAGKRKAYLPNTGKGGLRSLGAIESLLLLNEYHPRSMHFPPTDDDDEILAPGDDELANGTANNDWNGDSKFGGWNEPAVRSDRMCWSLIGMSYVLAYELGIFGSYADGILPVEQRVRKASSSPNQHLREDRIERALYIFATQASGRFGLPSMYSDHVNRFNLRKLQQGSASIDSSLLPEPVDKSQQCWVDLMSIMKATNEALFSSIDQTAALIQNGEYMGRLDQLQPLLRAWHQRFETLEVEKHPRMIISIEYHYISLYINSLALQAVVEQWTTKVNATPQVDSPASPTSSISSSFASIYSKNERYIKEVIDSSRTVLRHVVEGFLPGDYLKHAPVRTYFRIVAAAMFLLKTFALGAKAGEVSISLQLLDDTANALRTSYVDDVHICLRIADLLEGLIKAIRPKFVRLPPRPQEQQTQYTSSNAFNTQTRFQYRPNPADTTQNPLAGISRTYNSPSDSNIAIMPPLGNTYIPNANYNFSSPNLYSPNQQQNQQSYAMNNNNNNNSTTTTADFPMPMEEDWLTLDLNALLGDANSNTADSYWYGAFGPETQNNLDVLGKFMSDQPRGDGYGDGDGMGF